MSELEVYEAPASPSIPAVTRGDLKLYADLSRAVAATEFVPKGLRGNVPAVMACMLYGRAVGIDPMIALREIAVIDGNPTMSATLILGKVRGAGHSVTLDESADDRCIAKGKRADNGDEHVVTWTMSDAAQAGLEKKRNWLQYRRAMLRSRAVTELARALFSDLFSGLSVYTSEELGEEITDEEGQMIEGEVIETPEPQPDPEPTKISDAQMKKIHACIHELDRGEAPEGFDGWEAFVKDNIAKVYGKTSRKALTREEAHSVIEFLEAEIAKQPI